MASRCAGAVPCFAGLSVFRQGAVVRSLFCLGLCSRGVIPSSSRRFPFIWPFRALFSVVVFVRGPGGRGQVAGWMGAACGGGWCLPSWLFRLVAVAFGAFRCLSARHDCIPASCYAGTCFLNVATR